MPELAEAPTAVIAALDEVSKSTFNAEKGKVAGETPQPPATDDPPAPPNPPPPAGDDTPPPAAKKGGVPDDVLDPDKKTDAKVPEAIAEIDAAELPKNAKKEQIDSFNKLKEKSKTHLQQALNRVAELEEKIGKATSTADIEALQKKLADAEERASRIAEDFEKVAFEKSPRFQKQFAEAEKTALDLAKSYIDGSEIDPEVITRAAQATGRKRLDILKGAELDDATISAILAPLANYDTIQRQKQATLDNWKAESESWQQQEQQRTQAERERRQRQESEVWESVLKTTDLLPLRQSKDNADWNGRAEELKAKAREIFNGEGADLPTFAKTILQGVAYDAQQEVIDHLKERLTNAEAEVSRLKSAAPGGSITAGPVGGAPGDTSKMSEDERAKSTFNQQKALASAGG